MTDSQTLTLRPPVWALMTAVIIAGGFYIWGKNIERTPTQMGSITVSGEGKVFVAPDIAELSFGVQTGRQPTAAAAMQILKDKMLAVQKATKDAGVEEKDIRTESFWLNPSYEWTPQGRQILRGYEANQSLRVKVRDLDKVSVVLEGATNAGANQAGGVNFTIDDPEAKRAEARAEAIAEAQQKAERIAADLDAGLGDVLNFNENGGYWGGPVYAMKGEMAMGMGGATMDAVAPQAMPESTPLPAGEQEINVTVTITYELD